MNGQNSSIEVVRLPSMLSIRGISDVYAQICNSLNLNDQVVLDVPSGASVDLSFLQLVEAARSQAKIAGKSLALLAPVDDGIRAVLQRGGFLPLTYPEDSRFWFHEEMVQ